MMRLLSAEAQVKLADMRSGRMNDDDWTRMAKRMAEVSEAPLYIDDFTESDHDGNPGQEPAINRNRPPSWWWSTTCN